jgi:hypothetical protein
MFSAISKINRMYKTSINSISEKSDVVKFRDFNTREMFEFQYWSPWLQNRHCRTSISAVYTADAKIQLMDQRLLDFFLLNMFISLK